MNVTLTKWKHDRDLCEFDKRRASQRQSLWLVAGVLAFCAFAVGIAVLLREWLG